METHNQKSLYRITEWIRTGLKYFLIVPIRLYQFLLSPWLGNHCRFHPSCSHYAIEAIQEHGSVKGSALTLCRLSKCHPWHQGGYDPVPLNTLKQTTVNK